DAEKLERARLRAQKELLCASAPPVHFAFSAAARRASPRSSGSASGALVAIGQARMHSKHCANQPPEPAETLYHSILLSGSNSASSRSASLSARIASTMRVGTVSYCCDISEHAAM